MFKLLNVNYLWMILIVSIADAWLLSQIGLNEPYRVQHLSTYFSRVFISITVESKTFPTFVESQWPEAYIPMRSSVFPHYEIHANGNHSDCTRIHQAIWSQVDGLSRLWIMDIGWKNDKFNCAPKLLVFDLVKNNAEVLHIDCGNYIESDDIDSLVVKLGPRPSPCHVERFIYFAKTNNNDILAYDILEQNWHRHTLISKKYKNVVDVFPISPIDFAFGKHKELIVSDADGSLYRTHLSNSYEILLHEGSDFVGDDDSIEMELLGSLLGPSKGMMVDGSGALFYVVPKFGAVVRCEYKKNLTAEGNEIIFLTSKNIQQIFFGSEDSVWLLTDRLMRPQDRCFPGL